MQEIALPVIGTVAAWRTEVRRLAAAGVPPDRVVWRVGAAGRGLFDGQPVGQGPPQRIRLPRAALAEIETALCHSDPERFVLAHALVLRLGEGTLDWSDRCDPGLRRLLAMARAVRRDIHKMHAFVRFRELPGDGPRRRFAAWFEPEHRIVEAGTPFFARRFGDMDWIIATPGITAVFEGGALAFRPMGERLPPPEDAAEDLWRTYYASIFNPARLKVKAMQSEMPKKYWHNLPEASLIPDLVRSARARARDMADAAPTEPPARRAAAARAMAARPVPQAADGLDALRIAAAGCTRCPLHRDATQIVFGEGPPHARLMIVGEQPGDREDLAGRPFLGPAGQVLDACAAEAGLDRRAAYVTNAVKHFKFAPRGKRRIHKRASAGEIDRCRWWLDAERAALRPALIVAMGATAAAALTGSGRDLLRRRGRVEHAADGTPVLVTVHPSYILRLADPAAAAGERARLTADLRRAAELLARSGVG